MIYMNLHYLKWKSVRFSLFVSGLFGFFVFSAYTADLTTYLTTRNYNIDIKSVEDLLSNDKYKLNLLEGNQAHVYFQSTNKSMEKRIYEKFFKGEDNRYN